MTHETVEEFRDKERRWAEAAAKISSADYDGMVSDGDNYWDSVEALIEACACDDMTLPEIIWACTARQLRIPEVETLVEQATGDSYEGAYDDMLRKPGTVDRLRQAITEFNRDTNVQEWTVDYTRVVELSPEDQQYYVEAMNE